MEGSGMHSLCFTAVPVCSVAIIYQSYQRFEILAFFMAAFIGLGYSVIPWVDEPKRAWCVHSSLLSCLVLLFHRFQALRTECSATALLMLPLIAGAHGNLAGVTLNWDWKPCLAHALAAFITGVAARFFSLEKRCLFEEEKQMLLCSYIVVTCQLFLAIAGVFLLLRQCQVVAGAERRVQPADEARLDGALQVVVAAATSVPADSVARARRAIVVDEEKAWPGLDDVAGPAESGTSTRRSPCDPTVSGEEEGEIVERGGKPEPREGCSPRGRAAGSGGGGRARREEGEIIGKVEASD